MKSEMAVANCSKSLLKVVSCNAFKSVKRSASIAKRVSMTSVSGGKTSLLNILGQLAVEQIEQWFEVEVGEQGMMRSTG